MVDQERGAQTYFEDPAVDRLLGAVMTLAAELHVARDHSRVLERLLVDKGILSENEVAAFSPRADVAHAWDTERDEFIVSLMGALRGLERAKGEGESS